MKYTVMTGFDATTFEDVEADTPKEAMEKSSPSASVCHQCSGALDVGDPVYTVVIDDDGEEVLNTLDDEKLDERKKVLEEVRAFLDLPKARLRAWLDEQIGACNG